MKFFITLTASAVVALALQGCAAVDAVRLYKNTVNPPVDKDTGKPKYIFSIP